MLCRTAAVNANGATLGPGNGRINKNSRTFAPAIFFNLMNLAFRLLGKVFTGIPAYLT